jgi:Sulfotransferase domain
MPDASLALWSAPRSMSTAFFRMMAERNEFRLSHEPFAELAAGRPARIGDQEYGDAASFVAALGTGTPPVFFKDTSEYRHGLLFAEQPALLELTHTFIIREPRRVIESHYALNDKLSLDEVGFEHLAEIFEIVRQHTGSVPVVIDADTLVQDPAGVVSAYCQRVGLAERPETLSWRPGDRTEWAATSKWHTDAANSATFTSSTREYEVTTENSELLAGYLRHHLPFYQRLREHALVPVGSAR